MVFMFLICFFFLECRLFENSTETIDDIWSECSTKERCPSTFGLGEGVRSRNGLRCPEDENMMYYGAECEIFCDNGQDPDVSSVLCLGRNFEPSVSSRLTCPSKILLLVFLKN